MILFLDTSALVKLYIVEAGSEVLRDSLDNAVVAVSALTYGEVYATFARRLREGLMTQDEHSLCCQSFEEDWATLIQIPFTEEVLRQIPILCSRHPFWGADAMQMACGLMLRDEGVRPSALGTPGDPYPARRKEGTAWAGRCIARS
jgi:predicted nucleic acid-binding protein